MSYDENRISDQIEGGLIQEQELLDHFAGLAMQGMMVKGAIWSDGNCHAEYYAKNAYTMAKAMLKARKEVQP